MRVTQQSQQPESMSVRALGRRRAFRRRVPLAKNAGALSSPPATRGKDLKKMPPFAYEMHEMAHLAWAPARAVSDVARTWLGSPINPLSYTAAGRKLVA